MVEEEGLRQRKKQAMRRKLAETATRLFAERGFEAVTVADVAEAVGVSTQTVFNYFATKEDLVLDGRAEIEAELVAAVRDRPAGDSLLSAVRRHTLAVAERMAALPAERRAAFVKIVQSTPTVHARMRQMSIALEEELVQILVAEGKAAPHDPTSRLVANVIGLLARLAYGVPGWPDGNIKSYAEIIKGIDAAFELFEGGLAHYGVRAP